MNQYTQRNMEKCSETFRMKVEPSWLQTVRAQSTGSSMSEFVKEAVNEKLQSSQPRHHGGNPRRAL
jgi:ribosomal protein L12E/L44/L45/RPP1/RPP2